MFSIVFVEVMTQKNELYQALATHTILVSLNLPCAFVFSMDLLIKREKDYYQFNHLNIFIKSIL